MTLARLAMAHPADRILPAKCAFMAHTSLEQTRLLGYTTFNQDTVTTLLLGLLHKRPAVRHRSGVSDDILAFLRYAGHAIEEDMRIYETAEEARRHADNLIGEGYKLFWPYPLPEESYPSDAHLVPIPLWRRLNAKLHLDEITPPAHMPKRVIVALEHAHRHDLTGPVFVKAASDAVTGWGYAVHFCPTQDAFHDAIAWLRAREETHAIVEAQEPVETCWCVSLVIEPQQAYCIGAAEQIFASPGRQAGSVIDPANAAPDGVAALALTIGDAARRMGFIGVAGLDIAKTTDGRLIVFDPNFRFNASTTQVLFHDAAVARSGLAASASFASACPAPIAKQIERLRGPVDEGWFVPTRMIDAALLPSAKGVSHVTGFVLGADREDALQRQSALKALLAG
jgi:hypothetical protein